MSHPRLPRRQSDRGVTIVEAAIVFPVFFLIVLAIIEFGFFMAASSNTTSATRTGARVGSAELAPASSKAAVADKVEERVSKDLKGLTAQDSPQHLWIYKAHSDGSPCADVACATSTAFATCPDSVCYRYTGWDGNGFTAVAGAWATVDACPPTLDTVGVHLRVVHDYLSGVLGDDTVLKEQTVLRLEPLPLAQCATP